MAGARPRNVGWRLDYFLVNKDFIENVKTTEYLTDVEGSDHCPVRLEVKD
jgi:exodeoxyribonuclease-3